MCPTSSERFQEAFWMEAGNLPFICSQISQTLLLCTDCPLPYVRFLSCRAPYGFSLNLLSEYIEPYQPVCLLKAMQICWHQLK